MKQRAPYVVFTDLDGTLLDPECYSYRPATPALEELRTKDVPVVFCTSKTRAEVEAVRAELHNEHPFIVENGAAVYVPYGYFPFPVPSQRKWEEYDVMELGVRYAQVVRALRAASAASGCRVQAFHNMSAAEVAVRCGLGLQEAERAKQREYDEPFEPLAEDSAPLGLLLQWIEQEGFTWTRGGRFYHARGRHNKGQAAEVLAALYRRANPRVVTVGLGDGPNDISLLRMVDLPLATQGPRQWNKAILGLLRAPVCTGLPPD